MKILLICREDQRADMAADDCRQALPHADVRRVRSVEEAESELAIRRFDLLLLEQDTNLQHDLVALTGWPVVVLGDGVDPESRAHALRLGAAEYLAHREMPPSMLARALHYVQELAVTRERADSLAERVEFLATHDPLTGVRNRSSFFADLSDASEIAASHADGLALILVRLEAFRLINDTLGQQAGDTVLKVMAQRAAHVLRDDDFLYRTDGRQFAVLIHGAEDDSDLKIVAERLLGAMNRPLEIYLQKVECQISIGVARWPQDAESLDVLVSVADAAMRAASTDGGGIRFADPSMVPRALTPVPDTSLIRH